jgi:RNase adapter protein RapZ
VILTGLSGSGKGSVLNTFEDLGFYCVDNLPVSFIPTFSELYVEGSGEIDRAALLVDAREGEQIDKLPAVYRKLRAEHPATLVFIEASDDALMRRFSETRRPSAKAFVKSGGGWPRSGGSRTW